MNGYIEKLLPICSLVGRETNMDASSSYTVFKIKSFLLPHKQLLLLPRQYSTNFHLKPLHCFPIQQQEVDSAIMCECCNDRGWLTCDFCRGQKTNVKSENNRIYRRCPSCKAIGVVLCSKCKVYRCVTFPDHDDGEELNF